MVIDAEALFAENQHRLFKYFCRVVGQTDTARDLTQDVFLRVSRTAIPVGADNEVRAWLFSIARNLALDHHRRRLRHPKPVLLADEGARLPSQDVDFAVNEALAALPDLDRDVFLMREVAGLGYEEIGRVCGLTPDAVRSRIHRARLQLRQLSDPAGRELLIDLVALRHLTQADGKSAPAMTRDKLAVETRGQWGDRGPERSVKSEIQ